MSLIRKNADIKNVMLLAPEWPHPYSTLISGVFSLHQIAHVGVSPRIGLKLFGREIIFEEFQPTVCLSVTRSLKTFLFG